MENDHVRIRMLRALLAGMMTVRRGQLHPEELHTETKDGDGTIVTVMDRRSEAAIVAALGEIDGFVIQGEEGTTIGSGKRRIIFDPLDGTSLFAHGGITSTVIVAELDEEGLVVSCLIGEPISGRVLSAWHGEGTFRTIYAMEGKEPRILVSPMPVKVWEGQLGKKTAVLTDHTHGFTRVVDVQKRPVLTDAETSAFHDELTKRAALLKLGTNGGHQFLVANGGERVGGSVTLALGGAWDVAGSLLVLEAGGAAKAFHLDADRRLIERNPLDVFNYDILVTGNSPATVDTLVGLLKHSINR